VAAVRVKQHVAQGQLEDNTAHRPDVARMGPACSKKNIKMFVYDEYNILKIYNIMFPYGISQSLPKSKKLRRFSE
jgi:hypothetical protein